MKPALRAPLIGLGAALLALFLGLIPFFGTLERKTVDLRFSLTASPGDASDDVVLVVVDQRSLDFYEAEIGVTWPWPREFYVPVIEYCAGAGAKALVLDLIFSESSWISPAEDSAFGSAAALAGNVYFPLALSHRAALSPLEEEAFRRLSRAMDEPDYFGRYPEADGLLYPTGPILLGASGLGVSSYLPDPDGVVRRMGTYVRHEDRLVPGLPLLVVSDILGLASPPLPEGNTLTLGDHEIPLEPDGSILLNYHGPAQTYRTIGASGLIQSYVLLMNGMEPTVAPEELRDKIVIFGLVAPGLFDLRPSPLDPVYPGCEVLATAMDNLMNGDVIRRFPAVPGLILILLLGIAGAFLGEYSRSGRMVAVSALILLIPPLLAYLSFRGALWVPLVVPELAAAFGLFGAYTLNYLRERRLKLMLKGAFTHYVSPHVVDEILEDPDFVTRMGGERREVTLMFLDIAGFTTISEALEPKALVSFLVDVLSELSALILAEDGTIDKYEGDAIMAFFGAPLRHSNPRAAACRASIRCQEAVRSLGDHPTLKKLGAELRIRIGLCHGPAIIGNVGGKERFDYTAIGDTVNVAARLESANKFFGTSILYAQGDDAPLPFVRIEEETAFVGADADALVGRSVGRIRVKGKRKPVQIHAVLGEKAKIPEELVRTVRRFHEGLEAYQKGDFQAALRAFESIPEDGPARLYVRETKSLAGNPPEEWDGSVELKTK
jgi:adenylate cyclase